MSRLWHDAENILQAAEAAGAGASDWMFVRNRDGGWEMIAGSAWALDALAAEHGAEEVYQLRRQRNRISVEGRAGDRTVRLDQPDASAHLANVLGRHSAMYLVSCQE